MKNQHSRIDNLPAWRPLGVKRTTCGAMCIGGRACCLNGRIPHTMHICNNPSCACHASQRDDDQRANVPTCERANA